MKPSVAELRALARRDPRLGAVMKSLPRYPGFPDSTRKVYPTHYDALARAIVFQQLATKAATTIHGRVCALTTGPHMPRPHELLKLSERDLRACGLSANKLAALRDLAARIEDGRLNLSRVGRMSDERVIEELVEVRGIGEWSAQMFLLFRLGRPDVMAPGDLGIREGMRILEGHEERPTPMAALARAEVWRPFRSVGSWFMWRLVERQRLREFEASRAAKRRQSGAFKSLNSSR